MTVNWGDVERCSIWKTLGISECNNCNGLVACWGEEVELPEPIKPSNGDVTTRKEKQQ